MDILNKTSKDQTKNSENSEKNWPFCVKLVMSFRVRLVATGHKNRAYNRLQVLWLRVWSTSAHMQFVSRGKCINKTEKTQTCLGIMIYVHGWTVAKPLKFPNDSGPSIDNGKRCWKREIRSAKKRRSMKDRDFSWWYIVFSDVFLGQLNRCSICSQNGFSMAMWENFQLLEQTIATLRVVHLGINYEGLIK